MRCCLVCAHGPVSFALLCPALVPLAPRTGHWRHELFSSKFTLPSRPDLSPSTTVARLSISSTSRTSTGLAQSVLVRFRPQIPSALPIPILIYTHPRTTHPHTPTRTVPPALLPVRPQPRALAQPQSSPSTTTQHLAAPPSPHLPHR